MINKRALGCTGFHVTELGFGALEIGRDWAADVDPRPQHLTRAEAANVLNGVLDRGINFIDTAPAYWFSEEYIGAALSHRRDNYILATKVGEHCDKEGSYYDYSARATAEFIDRSLKRLNTEYLDLIQIHSASIEVLDRGETWNALNKAKEVGKVRFIGMTGTVEAAIHAVALGGFDTVQVPFNTLAPEAAAELFPACVRENIGVIIMRGLAGGKLTPKFQNLPDSQLKDDIVKISDIAKDLYPGTDAPLTRFALRFLKAQPAISTVIIGTRRLDALDQNIAELSTDLTSEEIHAFHKLLMK